ncbi:MAG: tetratricopeptide repeat protein [Gallionella sp.]|nr:tetratricopeptide repeat protein [Gallionella sp.]
MNQLRYLILSSVLLTACAHQPAQKVAAQDIPQVTQTEKSEPPEQEVVDTRVFPNVELTDELLYQFLLTEIANQRGETDVAVKASASLANKTRDPRVAMRAAQLAMESGQMDKAIDAIKLWREIEPTSAIAKRMLSSVLLRAGKLDEARTELAGMLKEDQANAAPTFIHLFQVLTAYPDKQAALNLMSDLTQPYPDMAEAHWSVAQLAQMAGDEKRALTAAKRASDLRPDWDMAASLEAMVLQKKAPQQGLDRLKNYLIRYPDAREIRMQYARALLDQKQYKLSRDEFQHLANDNPDSSEMAFAIAMISLQIQDYQGAEDQLRQALNKGKKDQDTVRYYLGQLEEAKKNEAEAIENYRQVSGGEYQFPAQVRIAYLLNKQGELAAAINILHQTSATGNQQRVQLIILESKLLLDAKQHAEAYKVLQQSLAMLPNNPDLLYETAMLAEKNGKPIESEKLLRKLIRIKPDDAHAYNALGFSLIERNERIAEAVKLVEKAMQLEPDDAAIIDSVGWGYYRSGRLEESIQLLRRAFANNPDPEIAAHLGEVLWMSGNHGEARTIWEDNLKSSPENVQLRAVIKKFLGW